MYLPGWIGAFPITKSFNFMEITLEKMTVPEKLRLMEALWDDLSRPEAGMELPAWHANVLHETGQRVAEGKETAMDWETAKKELRERFP